MMSALGVGGLLGAFVSGPLVERLGPGTTLLGTVGMQAVGALAMGATSEPWIVAVIAATYGLSATTWNVAAVSLRQSLTPDALRGRVASVNNRRINALTAGVDSSCYRQYAQNPEEARPKSRPLGVCSEVTMSLQSGSRQSPTSSRGVSSLPKPRLRSIRDRISGPKLLDAFLSGTEVPSRSEIHPWASLQ
jgi:Sugar (and other) transporter